MSEKKTLRFKKRSERNQVLPTCN